MLLAVFSAVDYCKHGYDTLVLDLLAIFKKTHMVEDHQHYSLNASAG